MCQNPPGSYDYMGMRNDEQPSLLLALRGGEAIVMIDALVAFANAEEQSGDPCGVAPVADYVASRLRGLDGLCGVGPELMKVAGLGRFENRPQG